MDIINIDVNKMSEKEFSNIIKILLSRRYNEAKRIDIVLYTHCTHHDTIQIMPKYEFNTK